MGRISDFGRACEEEKSELGRKKKSYFGTCTLQLHMHMSAVDSLHGHLQLGGAAVYPSRVHPAPLQHSMRKST